MNHLTDVCASWVSQAATRLKKAEQPMAAAEQAAAIDCCPLHSSILELQGPLSIMKQENDFGRVLCDGTAGLRAGRYVCNETALVKEDGPANLDALVEVSLETRESVAAFMTGDDDGDLFGATRHAGLSWCLADVCPCDSDETTFGFDSLQTPSDLVLLSAL